MGATLCNRGTSVNLAPLCKFGLDAANAEERVGELYLADIGVPPSLYAVPTLGLPEIGPLFAASDVMRLKLRLVAEPTFSVILRDVVQGLGREGHLQLALTESA